jgi:ubiquinone/menaquinone biosynthesis C-methylase UbiE
MNHFDLIASFYDRIIGKADTKRLRSLLKLPNGGLLLDAGGGTGRVSSALRPFVGDLVVSDLSHLMLKQARNKGNLRPVQSHAEMLPFFDNVFDRIIVIDALHHFCNQEIAIGDIIRVLKPGGRLVIEEPDISRNTVRAVAWIERFALMRSHFYTSEEIIRMIAGYGLAAHVADTDRFRMWLVADKQ